MPRWYYSKERKRHPHCSTSQGHYTSHATGNVVSKSMISITEYTSLCKGNFIIITGPSESFCPICGGELNVRGTCIRKVRKEGTTQSLRLRVMKCRNCQKTHREIPDDIIPYKRTGLTNFCEIAEAEATDYPCDTSTWQRMKRSVLVPCVCSQCRTRLSLFRIACDDNGHRQSVAGPDGLFCPAGHKQRKLDTQPFGDVCRIEVLYTVAII